MQFRAKVPLNRYRETEKETQMEATQTATGYVSAATVLSAGQEGAKAVTIAEKLIAATSKKARGYY